MLGTCPYCEDGTIGFELKQVQGIKTKLYRCSNANFETQDGELYESTGSCSYQIWGNALLRYGKRFIGPKEVKLLLDEGQFIATLHAKGSKNAYQKYVITHPEYGIEVLFSEEVE